MTVLNNFHDSLALTQYLCNQFVNDVSQHLKPGYITGFTNGPAGVLVVLQWRDQAIIYLQFGHTRITCINLDMSISGLDHGEEIHLTPKDDLSQLGPRLAEMLKRIIKTENHFIQEKYNKNKDKGMKLVDVILRERKRLLCYRDLIR